MEWFDTLGGWEQGRFLYLLVLLLIIAMFSLPLRRIGVGRLLGYALVWAAIIGVGWIALDGSPVAQRYIARLNAPEDQGVAVPTAHGEVRVRAGGHRRQRRGALGSYRAPGRDRRGRARLRSPWRLGERAGGCRRRAGGPDECRAHRADRYAGLDHPGG